MYWWGRCFGGGDVFVQSVLEKPIWVVSRQHYIMLHPFACHLSGAIDVLTLLML